ncbi:MAG: BrnT family toxin [Gammaproteobacteria bacterium]|nr:BrnT family toxin [Gammaproteobacteria bacterium]
MDFELVSGFDWDAGNLGKNAKHGVDNREAEEVFFNQPLLLTPDDIHSDSEVRWRALGRTDNGNAASPKISTGYVYNGFSNLRQVTSPDTGVTVYRYDTAGNRISQTDSRAFGQGNLTITYEFDALSRLHTINYPTPSAIDVILTYDENDNGQNGRGRLTTVVDEAGTTKFKYDARGNVREKSFTFTGESVAYVTSYTYTAADQVWTITYPLTQRVVTYQRNSMGQITGITSRLPNESSDTVIISQGVYEPFGPLHSWIYGSGSHQVAATDTHDLSYRIMRSTHDYVLDREYTIDVADNVRHVHDYLLSGNEQDFNYDTLDRLTNAQVPQNPAKNYEYDYVGNRTREANTNEIYSYYTDPANKHLNWLNTNQPGTTPTTSSFSRTYDAVGNLSSKLQLQVPTGFSNPEWFAYGYGDSNRLTWVLHNDNSNNQDYMVTSHNWRGQPVADVYGTGAFGPVTGIEYLQTDEQAHPLLVGRAAPTNAWAQEFIYLNDLAVAYYLYDANGAASGPYFIHSNHLGAPVKVTDSLGGTVVNMQYDAFGERTVLSSSIQPPRLGLPWQTYTQQGWFVHNYFREYDPSTGRYLEADPIGLAGGINPYVYVGANPLKFIDRLGLCRCKGGRWDQTSNLAGSLFFGGGFSFSSDVIMTCRSDQTLKCKMDIICIGGGPLVGAGLGADVAGSTGGVNDSQNFPLWSNYFTGGAGPVSTTISTAGGSPWDPGPGEGGASISLMKSIGGGVGYLACRAINVKCTCPCEDK